MAAQKKFSLGRGLDALISTDRVETEGSSKINEIRLDEITANANQPRKDFDEEALNELAESIREIGIIQPVTLRQTGEHSYQIIAGERRYRASLLAGKETIPAYIRTASDENVMEMALIENIQREDLNAVEIALAYQHLMEQYGLTQEKLSERVGKKRTTIANYLRLLKLPAQIQMALQNKTIDMGHARALIALDNPRLQMKVFGEIIDKNLSVRRVEEIVKAMNSGDMTGKSTGRTARGKEEISAEFDELKKQLADFFGTKVKLSYTKDGKGKISIPFDNEKDLERIMELFDSIRK